MALGGILGGAKKPKVWTELDTVLHSMTTTELNMFLSMGKRIGAGYDPAFGFIPADTMRRRTEAFVDDIRTKGPKYQEILQRSTGGNKSTDPKNTPAPAPAITAPVQTKVTQDPIGDKDAIHKTLVDDIVDRNPVASTQEELDRNKKRRQRSNRTTNIFSGPLGLLTLNK